jgi:ATP-dependent RNA helicase RhlE
MLGGRTRIRSAVVYGGVGIGPQIRALKTADIVVACPGRLLDHIERRSVDLSRLKVLVLDEADQMFDMGFLPSIRRILNHIPLKTRQTLLFSATMPEDIRMLAKDILKNPAIVRIGTVAPAKTVRHAMFPVAQHLKTALLLKLLAHASGGSVLVFTRTKHRARSLGEKLSKSGYRSTSLQGNLSQARRQAALRSFRSGDAQILVATDIAARGIDVSNVSHVINYDVPTTPEAYIHRIGRTGRAECSGEAFTLVTEEDTRMVSAIQRTVGGSIEKRTLSDFDYEAHSFKPVTSTKNAKSRSRRTDVRRKSNVRRRTGEGAFAWFLSGTAAGA